MENVDVEFGTRSGGKVLVGLPYVNSDDWGTFKLKKFYGNFSMIVCSAWKDE